MKSSRVLTDRQKRIHEKLNDEFGSYITACYLSMKMVYKCRGVPERLPMVGHLAREILQALPKILDIPVENPLHKFSKIQKLGKNWNSAIVKKDEDHAVVTMSFNLKVYEEQNEYFANYDSQPNRAEGNVELLRKFDKSSTHDKNSPHIKLWTKVTGYFTGIAHNPQEKRDEINEEKFKEYMNLLDNILFSLVGDYYETKGGTNNLDKILANTNRS